MKKIFFIILILLFFAGITNAAVHKSKLIIVKSFYNKSEYKGRWNIGNGIAELLWKELRFKGVTNALFLKYYCISKSKINKDIFIISGDIIKFKFKEHIIAAYKIGGYKNYSVEIIIRLKIKSGEGEYREKVFKTKISRRNIGITLFGGPGGTDDFEKSAYSKLQKLNFGSNKFLKSIYGIAVQDIINKMSDWIKDIFVKKKQNHKD